MSTRQYIGARYVPKFYEGTNGSDWDSGVAYEPLTVVTYLGNSYTSKKPVPSGVGDPMHNPEYWASTGIYNTQVEEYRQEVEEYRQEVAGVQSDVDDLETALNNASKSITLMNKRILIIGDSISDEALYPNCWVKNFRERLHPSNTLTNISLQGRTITSVSGETNNLMGVTSSITGTYDIILVYLGVNDWSRQLPLGTILGSGNNVSSALQSFASWIGENQPTARVAFVTPLKSKKNDFAGHKLLQFYTSAICANATYFGWQIIDAHSFAPFMNPNWTNRYTRDGIHPMDSYSPYLADYIYDNLEKETSSVGTNATSVLAIGDVGGSATRISSIIYGDGSLGFNVHDFDLSTSGTIKLADIPEECAPRNALPTIGMITQADGTSVPVLLAIVNGAMYVTIPTGVAGTLTANFTNLSTAWSLTTLNGSF